MEFKFSYTYDVNIKYSFAVADQPFQSSNHSHHDKSGYKGVAHTFLSPWNGNHFTTTTDAPNTVTTIGNFEFTDISNSLIAFMIRSTPGQITNGITKVEIDGQTVVVDTIASHTHLGWKIDHFNPKGGLPVSPPTYLEELSKLDQFSKAQYIPSYRFERL